MDKGVGLNQFIKRAWLDSAAAFSAECQDVSEMRERLTSVVLSDGVDPETTRKTVDILVNIWF